MESKTFGFDELQKKLIRIAEQEAPEKIDNQVDRMQTQVLADVKQGTPVKSGNLKRKWRKGRVEQGRGEVSNPEPYAEHIEKGFRHKKGGYKVPGVHMMESALERLQLRMPSEMNDFFDDLMKDLRL